MPETLQTLAFTEAELASLALRILDLDPDPAPRYLVLRDLWHCAPGEASLRAAQNNLSESRWIIALAGAQQPDGTWGRFHTQDTRVKRLFPTSEYAIRRALALGLDQHSPVLQKVSGFIRLICRERPPGRTRPKNTIIHSCSPTTSAPFRPACWP
jgi:hypothetical protein